MSELRNVTTSNAVLGAVLARLRTAKNLKQSDMAVAVGIGPSSWSRIEKGETSPSIDQLRLAANVLGDSAGNIIELAEEAEKEAIRKGVIIDTTGKSNIFGSAPGGSKVALGIAAASIIPVIIIPVIGPILQGLIGGVIGAYLKKQNKLDT